MSAGEFLPFAAYAGGFCVGCAHLEVERGVGQERCGHPKRAPGFCPVSPTLPPGKYADVMIGVDPVSCGVCPSCEQGHPERCTTER